MVKLTHISSARVISEGWFSKPEKRIDKPFTSKVNTNADKATMDVVKRKDFFRTKSLPPASVDKPLDMTNKPMRATTPTGRVPATSVPKRKFRMPYIPTTDYNMPTDVPDSRVIMRHPTDVSPLDIAISKHKNPNGFGEPKGTHGRPVMHNKRPPVAGIQYPKELTPQEKKMRAEVDQMMLDAFKKASQKK